MSETANSKVGIFEYSIPFIKIDTIMKCLAFGGLLGSVSKQRSFDVKSDDLTVGS